MDPTDNLEDSLESSHQWDDFDHGILNDAMVLSGNDEILSISGNKSLYDASVISRFQGDETSGTNPFSSLENTESTKLFSLPYPRDPGLQISNETLTSYSSSVRNFEGEEESTAKEEHRRVVKDVPLKELLRQMLDIIPKEPTRIPPVNNSIVSLGSRSLGNFERKEEWTAKEEHREVIRDVPLKELLRQMLDKIPKEPTRTCTLNDSVSSSCSCSSNDDSSLPDKFDSELGISGNDCSEDSTLFFTSNVLSRSQLATIFEDSEESSDLKNDDDTFIWPVRCLNEIKPKFLSRKYD